MPSVVLAALFGFPKALSFTVGFGLLCRRGGGQRQLPFSQSSTILSLFLSAKPIKLLQIRTLIPGFFYFP
jgi:hypothetical protein